MILPFSLIFKGEIAHPDNQTLDKFCELMALGKVGVMCDDVNPTDKIFSLRISIKYLQIWRSEPGKHKAN